MMHKSNATYFSDLDMARGHHVYALCRQGIRKYPKIVAMLGGLSCTFRKEIKAYKKYEIWTRVLSWDQKWVFIVSHFVKAGAVKPREYSDQPWIGGGKVKGDKKESAVENGAHPAIYATFISKYVFKDGRKTVSPALIFQESGLMPVAPTSDEHESNGSTENSDTKTKDAEKVSDKEISENIEAKRLQGLSIAQHMLALDEAHAVFTGNDDIAFARL
jgi:hypothetical protein